MTKEEIKKYVEDQIEYHCDEFGLSREEVEETVMINIIGDYEKDEISKEDLIQCGEYLGFNFKIKPIDVVKMKRCMRKQKCKAKKKGKSLDERN